MLSAAALKILLVLVVAVGPVSAVWAQFTQMVSIGDSLSDTGNTDDLTLGFVPDNDYFFGRFSNGQTWNELLALDLGLSAPTPSRDGGTNYAHGGALTEDDYIETFLFLTFVIPSALNQISEFVGAVGVGDVDGLYTLSIGGNDILGVGDTLSSTATPSEIALAETGLYNIAQGLEPGLQQLLAAIPTGGEARLVLMNAPNVGVTPRAIVENKETLYTTLSTAYNNGLQALVDTINDPRIIVVDFFALTTDVVANPGLYGFTNVTDRCLSAGGSVCANPDDYLFWDDIHPTVMGHTALMLQVKEQLFAGPEIFVPISGWFVGGLMMLILLVRRISAKHTSRY